MLSVFLIMMNFYGEMMGIPFYKMTGGGNDFIIIDNRDGKMNSFDIKEFVIKTCKRCVSIGADGLFLIEDSDKADFKWQFYNSDGSVAEMCGNGARCVSRYAYINGIVGEELSFETLAGIIKAEIKEGVNVKAQLTDYFDLREDYSLVLDDGEMHLSSVNTGVPHAVVRVDDIENADLIKIGKAIRYHKEYAPAGTNVNLYSVIGENKLRVRTYERGVEGETLACGTGAAACALISSRRGEVKSPVEVVTSGGVSLVIHLEEEGTFLEGEARVVYTGEINAEAYKY